MDDFKGDFYMTYFKLDYNSPIAIPRGTYKPFSVIGKKSTIEQIDDIWSITGWSDDKTTLNVSSSSGYNASVSISQYTDDTYFITNQKLGLLRFDNNCYQIEATEGGFATLTEAKTNPARFLDSSQLDQCNSLMQLYLNFAKTNNHRVEIQTTDGWEILPIDLKRDHQNIWRRQEESSGYAIPTQNILALRLQPQHNNNI